MQFIDDDDVLHSNYASAQELISVTDLLFSRIILSTLNFNATQTRMFFVYFCFFFSGIKLYFVCATDSNYYGALNSADYNSIIALMNFTKSFLYILQSKRAVKKDGKTIKNLMRHHECTSHTAKMNREWMDKKRKWLKWNKRFEKSNTADIKYNVFGDIFASYFVLSLVLIYCVSILLLFF